MKKQKIVWIFIALGILGIFYLSSAFAIPICELVDWDENKPQALVLTPTRELATQVKEDMFHIGRFKRLKVAVVYGKYPFHVQEKELKQKTHVVVGTPGRLIDHIERGTRKRM